MDTAGKGQRPLWTLELWFVATVLKFRKFGSNEIHAGCKALICSNMKFNTQHPIPGPYSRPEIDSVDLIPSSFVSHSVDTYWWNTVTTRVIELLLTKLSEVRGTSRASVGRSEGNRALGRPRRRRENNIWTDLAEIGWQTWSGLIWISIETSRGLLWMR